MRTIIHYQRKERDLLLSRTYLARHTQYDSEELLRSKQIKLITGPRRTGKSTEALLMLRGKNFAYLNFDDGKLLKEWDDDVVWESLQQVYPGFDYLLLDEVQNLDGWDLWVSKLYRLGVNYLSTLFDSIIWKDIAKRHNVRNVEDLNNLAMYLVSNFCNRFSANELAHELGLSSVATTKKFMGYLREPYLFYYLPRYNNKLKLMKKAPQKVYVVDNGFVEAKAFSVNENLGRLLENQVFIELVRRGYDTDKSLFYYRSRNDKEVDFVTRKGVRVEMLIQVCYDLSSERTLKREVDSLIECAEELKCRQLLIITRNEARMIEKNGYEIRVVPIKEF